MPNDYGVSFVPGQEDQNSPGGPANGPGGAPPLQQAIQFISTRLPRVAGANAMTPQGLLGNGGMQGNPTLEQLLALLFGPNAPMGGGMPSGGPSGPMGGGPAGGGLPPSLPPPNFTPGGGPSGSPPPDMGAPPPALPTLPPPGLPVEDRSGPTFGNRPPGDTYTPGPWTPNGADWMKGPPSGFGGPLTPSKKSY